MMMIARRFWPRRVFGRERNDRPLDAPDFSDGPLRREADGLPLRRPRRIAGDRDQGLRPRNIIPLTAFDATSDTPPGPGTFSNAFKTSASFATAATPRRLHLPAFCAEWARKSTGQ